MEKFILFLKEDLNRFIKDKMGQSNIVVFANLNNILESSSNVDNKIIVSIAALEEDKSMKSPDNYVKQNNNIVYHKPAVWINLVCLFTFYRKSTENLEGINTLAYIIEYFQSKARLDKQTALIPSNFPPGLDKVVAEMVTLDFEKSNYLWGMFGGKYHPSVIYRFKSIPIDNAEFTPGPAIEDTKVNAVQLKPSM